MSNYNERLDEKCIISACPMSRIKYEPYCPAHARKYGGKLRSVKIKKLSLNAK